MVKKIVFMGMVLLPCFAFGASERVDAERSVKIDQKLAREIQEEVSEDRTLNPLSRSIDVVVQNGVFVLRGVVQSQAERQAIQAKAESKVTQKTPDALVAEGAIKIDNELTVAHHWAN